MESLDTRFRAWEREEQVKDLYVDDDVDGIYNLLRLVAEQAYLAGMRRVTPSTAITLKYSPLLGEPVGDDRVLINTYIQEKGLNNGRN
jgi:hypothetical protein